MAISDANAFPTRGQAFRLPIYIFNSSGDPVTTAWAGITVTVSSNGMTTSVANGLTQITGTNMGWIDLSASVMDTPLVQVAVTGSGLRGQNISIYTVDLSDTPGATLRLDRIISWLFRRWRNRRQVANGQLRILRDGNSLDTYSTGGVTTSGQSTEALEMS